MGQGVLRGATAGPRLATVLPVNRPLWVPGGDRRCHCIYPAFHREQKPHPFWGGHVLNFLFLGVSYSCGTVKAKEVK